jgi:hypothetical protein
VTPLVSIEDRTVIGLLCVQDFAVLATYSSKPNTLAIPLCKMTTAHWECGDGESSVYPSCESTRSGVGRWCTVLSGSTGPVHILEDLSEGLYM